MLRKIQKTVLILLAVFPLAAFASEINLPRSGQSTSYATGDDGAMLAGLPSPASRFTAASGKVIDNLTGLVWLQNANCTDTIGGVAKDSGTLTWANALTWSNSLAANNCGLTDSSVAGQWRLPTKKELESLQDLAKFNPALPTGHPFTNVQASYYWSSSTYAVDTNSAWQVNMGNSYVVNSTKTGNVYVWPVRGGQ